jgi:hypothetical protein
MQQSKVLCGCLRRRQCLVPTLRGWAVLVLGLAAAVVIGGRGIARFLSVNDPRPGGVLVVEGWAPDYAMEAAVAEFNRNHYDKLFVTGIPLDRGAPLSEYKTYAELGAAVLVKLGLNTNVVQPVPVAAVRQDRTYAMASGLRRWMDAHGMAQTNVNLMTIGPHARRSRLMFEQALGKGLTVGVTAIPSREFDAERWWRSSAGVRTVIGEALGYAYARLLFSPPKE